MINTLFYLSLAMFAGLLMTRVTRLVRLPNVTAYLIAGVLIGPYVSNLINIETISDFEIITECTLGFIAFSIGDEFKIQNLKAIGKPALIITLFESVSAVITVFLVTKLFGYDSVLCIVLGALAASTAPAATLLIIRQYKASGPLTNHLLPVVAADDATGLIAFSVCISIAQGMVHDIPFSIMNTICMPLFNIFLSIFAGAVMGFFLALSHRFFRSHTNRMSFCIAFVFMGVALAEHFSLSSLLLCMMMGAMYINLYDSPEKVLKAIDDWTYPLFMLFFIISGAQLDLKILPEVGVLGLIYIFARFGGKFFGSYVGAKISDCPRVVRDNIGWALMPQAGVAIGMATMVLTELPAQYAQPIQTVILSATLVYEIVGPITTKSALKRAGEI